jgi:hypothetical protein
VGSLLPDRFQGKIEGMAQQTVRASQPRWPVSMALMAIGGLYWAMPSALTIGPDWLVLVLVLIFSLPAIFLSRTKKWFVGQVFGYAVSGVVTVALIVSLILLVSRLPAHKETPAQLLVAASALWISNLLVFACWYWRLDAGGPNQRDLRGSHTDGAFLFPQMTLDPVLRREMEEDTWSPGFVDYLFLAFNTSTAFSPTDVPVLSRWAKGLMMIQSTISLMTIAILAARAINIL